MDISVALGGGGSKGNSHIGVLRRLEQEGFHIRAVAGTSFGGIVAVFYAMGFSPQQIEEAFSAFDQESIYGRFPEDEPSFLGIAGGVTWLESHIGPRTFQDLKIPCALTAVDLNSATEVILTQGSLMDALLATVAIPGIFPSQRYGERQLVDGGVLNPVPVAPARSLAPNIPVVAVSLNALMGEPAQSWSLPRPRYLPEAITERLSRMRYAQAVNVILRSVDIMSRAVAEYRLAVDKPDVIIRPQVSDIDILEKVNVREIAFRGDQAVELVLPELTNLYNWQNRIARFLKIGT